LGSVSGVISTFTVNGISLGQNVVITITPVGSACGTVGTFNCSASNCTLPTVSVNSPSICSGASATVTASPETAGTYSYAWTVPSGVTNPGNVVSFSTTVAGTYSVIITDTATSCPSANTSGTVTENALPTVSVNSPSTCAGASATVTATAGTAETYIYAWTVPSGATNPGNVTSFTTTIAGTYSVIITNTATSCPSTSTLGSVTVNATPEVFGSGTTTICSGESTNIALSTNIIGTQFKWKMNPTRGVTGVLEGSGDTINEIIEAGTTAGTEVYTITPTLNDCDGNSIVITVNVNPLPAPMLVDGIICIEQATNDGLRSYTLDTGLNNKDYNFDWYDLNHIEISGAVSNSYEAITDGQYSVIVTNKTTRCLSKEVYATVTSNYLADAFDTSVSIPFAQIATITITKVHGGTGPFLYRLDGGMLQSSNVFADVSGGTHTVTLQDEQGCTSISKDVLVIDYPKYFTPNGDGFNDTWNIKGLDDKNAKIFIFDRYGKLIKQISTNGAGWDGTYHEIDLPSSDYWFTIDYLEKNVNIIFRNHFALKR
jgi:gliding motility-associated-like protein